MQTDDFAYNCEARSGMWAAPLCYFKMRIIQKKAIAGAPRTGRGPNSVWCIPDPMTGPGGSSGSGFALRSVDPPSPRACLGRCPSPAREHSASVCHGWAPFLWVFVDLLHGRSECTCPTHPSGVPGTQRSSWGSLGHTDWEPESAATCLLRGRWQLRRHLGGRWLVCSVT